jgi:hypothetical protein
MQRSDEGLWHVERWDSAHGWSVLNGNGTRSWAESCIRVAKILKPGWRFRVVRED